MLKSNQIEAIADRLTLPADTPGLTESQIAEHNAAVRSNSVELQQAFCAGDVSFEDATTMTSETIRTTKDARRAQQLECLQTRCTIGSDIPQIQEGHESAKADLIRFVSHLLNT